jgi:hypothetical protein
MSITFEYRNTGAPMITATLSSGRVIMSEVVSYQGIASINVNGITYIAVGDYFDGHTPMIPGKVYQISEVR